MKQTKLLLAIACVAVLLSACKKDPKPGPGKDDPQTIEVTELTLNKTVLTLEIGDVETLTASVAPDNATNKTISWSSSKTDIASVDQSGKVTAVSAGEATITASSSNGKTATCTVKVKDAIIPITSISINQKASGLSLIVGESETLVATITPENATETLIWESDSDAFSVDQNGTVTALKAGEGCIIAHNEEYTIYDVCGVGVSEKPGALKTINGIKCAYIPFGEFEMGSPSDEYNRETNEEQHTVKLNSFWMSQYEITNANYCEFLNDPDVEFNAETEDGYTRFIMTVNYLDDNYGYQKIAEPDIIWDEELDKWAPVEGKENYPINYVSWYGAVAYADWMSGKNGIYCYLPTEAQWEYACRGGQEESLPFGIGDGTKLEYLMANFIPLYAYDLSKQGEYIYPEDYKSPDGTEEVGTYDYPNAFNLYDMHGNVAEWCWDWYAADYYEHSGTYNPKGPYTGEKKIVRGGHLSVAAKYCRSAYRSFADPINNPQYFGFRVIFQDY